MIAESNGLVTLFAAKNKHNVHNNSYNKAAFSNKRLIYKKIVPYNRPFLFHYQSFVIASFLLPFQGKSWGRGPKFHWKQRGVHHNS